MVVEAGAGTGKTTTLRLLAEAMPERRGLYIAYNRSIAHEAAASFPQQVECRTAHSLAWSTYGAMFAERVTNGNRVKPWDAAKMLGIFSDFKIGPKVTLKPWQQWRLVKDTITRFCYSDSMTIEAWHVPRVDGCEDMLGLRKFILQHAVDAWNTDIIKPEGTLPFTHDFYLKMWAMSLPRLGYDYIMLDEAQDANPVIAQVFSSQTHAQQVSVGDSCQAIYGWRGATDYLTSAAQEVDHHLFLSQSFRFGPAVAEEANKWLESLNSPLRLEGFDQVPSELCKLNRPDAILCRTNAQVVSEAISAMEDGQRVSVVGGLDQVAKFADEAEKLQRGQHSTHPDLQGFETWADVQEFAQTSEGRELAVSVRLVDRYGPARIRAVASKTVPESQADVVASTAHKAKGREWSAVRIAPDFADMPLDEDGLITRPEQMLAYVSVTRAMRQLDRGALALIDQYMGQGSAGEQLEAPEGMFVVGQRVQFAHAEPMVQDPEDPSPLIDFMDQGGATTITEVRLEELVPGGPRLTQVVVEWEGEHRTFAHYFLQPVLAEDPLKV